MLSPLLKCSFLLLGCAIALHHDHPSKSTNFDGLNTVIDTLKTIRKDTILIQEVAIKANTLSPEEKLKRKQEEYRIIYLHGDNSNIFAVPKLKITENFSLPLPMLLMNINNIYNHFSKTGKQARRFQGVLIDEYQKDKIEEIWLPLTAKHSKLTGQQLEDFRLYYEPEFEWLMKAEEYEKLDYLFKKLVNYQDSAVYIRQSLSLR